MPENSYYRLKQTDFDGVFSYSNIIRVYNGNITSDGFEIQSITPTPFASFLNIEVISNTEKEVDYALIDSRGKDILRGTALLNKGISSIELKNLEKLSSGIYILHLSDGEKKNYGESD